MNSIDIQYAWKAIQESERSSVWLALSVLIYRWGKPRVFVTQPVAKEAPVKGKAP